MKQSYGASREYWNKQYTNQEKIDKIMTPSDFIKSMSYNLKKGTTLCLGSGQGRNAHYLSEIGHNVTAIDISDKAIEKSEKFCSQNDLTIDHHVKDILEYEMPSQYFDNIICCRLTLPLHEWKVIMPRIHDSIKITGKLLIEGFTHNHKEDEMSFLYSWFYGLDPQFFVKVLKGFEIDYINIDKKTESTNESTSLSKSCQFEYLKILARRI